MGLQRPIAVGAINYANAWPLFDGLEPHLSDLPHHIRSGVPSELNRLLQAGELDISAISSFSYGRYCKEYRLLPGLSVGSAGPVHSILLFLKAPIEQRKPERIAVSTTSETSVNLLKIIMALRYECSPDYRFAEPDLDAMLASSDGALLIGDPAIAGSWRKDDCHVLDLGKLWHEWTGLGMTYAVVAARKAIIERAPESVAAVYEAMLATRRQNVEHVDGLTAKATRRLGGTETYWQRYFQTLQYDFSDTLQQGLELYFRYAKQLNLLPDGAELMFYEDILPKR